MADDPYQFRLSPEEEAALEEEWAEEQATHYPTPLPTDGDKLFKKNRNKQREEMHRTFKPAMTYINGYERAADLLYAQLQDGAKQGDSTLPAEHWLVYPVYFMYRHALELSLKNILRTASPTLNEKQRERITETHNVYTLWSMAKSWVMQFASDELRTAMPAFESMLNEIQIHDPEGEAGRYEMRKVGKRPNRILVATFPSLSPLDATAIHDGFSKMLNYIRTIWAVYAEIEQEEAMMLKPPDIESFIARWLKPDEA